MHNPTATKEQFEDLIRENLSDWEISTLNFDAASLLLSVNANRILEIDDMDVQVELTELAFKSVRLASSYWNDFLPFRFMMYRIDFANIPEGLFERILVKLALLTDNDKYFVVDTSLCTNNSSLLVKSSAVIDIDTNESSIRNILTKGRL